ncbi:MAG TPA: class I SAM-dependent RNA methyltransferase [Desulfuromonadales bacterium]|nr:class I SAM-dependent RNA methyltransferase [Desulfuromonadales bacterium]
MKKTFFSLFAATTPGFEKICARELRSLALPDIEEVRGGVEFTGDLGGLYRANLWLRSANRVLARVGSFRSRDFPRLYQRALQLPWGRFIKPLTPVEVRVTSRGSRLMHSGRIAETVSSALDRALGRTGNPPTGDEGKGAQLVLVRIEDDLCCISVDSSGALLHRRGYRSEAGAAPLRETLAAGLLMKSGWSGTIPLYDPFCGSGTLPIEAAMLAAGKPPGSNRLFAFMNWPRYRPGLWQALVAETVRDRADASLPFISGSDRDAEMIEIARRNAHRAEVAQEVSFQVLELTAQSPVPGPGLVFCNPPYGTRLGTAAGLASLYRQFGQVCRERFPGWQVAFICPDPRLAEQTGLSLSARGPFSNGGLQVHLYQTEL